MKKEYLETCPKLIKGVRPDNGIMNQKKMSLL